MKPLVHYFFDELYYKLRIPLFDETLNRTERIKHIHAKGNGLNKTCAMLRGSLTKCFCAMGSKESLRLETANLTGCKMPISYFVPLSMPVVLPSHLATGPLSCMVICLASETLANICEERLEECLCIGACSPVPVWNPQATT